MPATTAQRLARLRHTKADAVLVILHPVGQQAIPFHGKDIAALRRHAAKIVRYFRHSEIADALWIPTRRADGAMVAWDSVRRGWRR